MTTLRKAAELSQKIIKVGAILIVTLMVGRLVVSGAISWYKAKYPNIPSPTIGFGLLPSVQFPEQEKKQLTYKLETVTSSLPSFPNQADVLMMKPMRPNLLALEKSTEVATLLGFKVEPEKVSDTTYRWRLQTPIPMSLTMSIYDGRFIWKTDWSSNPNFLAEKTLPLEKQAVKEVKNMVSRIESESDDINEGISKASYLRGLNGNFESATALSEADFIQIDLFRKNYLDQYKFVTPETGHGTIRVIMSGNLKTGRITQVIYNNFLINYSLVETYPLRPVNQAWQGLQQGNGYVASLDPGITEVVIRRVDLAYYDSFEPQQYMQPVYVFSGDNNFVAYIQGVKEPKSE